MIVRLNYDDAVVDVVLHPYRGLAYVSEIVWHGDDANYEISMYGRLPKPLTSEFDNLSVKRIKKGGVQGRYVSKDLVIPFLMETQQSGRYNQWLINGVDKMLEDLSAQTENLHTLRANLVIDDSSQ